MPNEDNLRLISSRLIDYLLTIPFPYRDILKSQINASEYIYTSFPDYHCIHFKRRESASTFPQYLDAMPLSWQIITTSAPYLCQLFIKEGCIDKLEIINMLSGKIEWDKVWNTTPLLDYEYSIPFIANLFETNTIEIRKVLHTGSCVDFAIKVNENFFVASYRDCNVRRLVLERLPDVHSLRIDVHKSGLLCYTVSSNTGDIDFDCSLMYLQWHKSLS